MIVQFELLASQSSCYARYASGQQNKPLFKVSEYPRAIYQKFLWVFIYAFKFELLIDHGFPKFPSQREEFRQTSSFLKYL